MIAESKPIPPEDGQPSVTGVNGRGKDGRFAPGNKAAKGNPHFKRMAELRGILLNAVTDSDLEEVAQTLIGQAKAGDIDSIKELFNRVLGKVIEAPSEPADDDTINIRTTPDALRDLISAAGKRYIGTDGGST